MGQFMGPRIAQLTAANGPILGENRASEKQGGGNNDDGGGEVKKVRGQGHIFGLGERKVVGDDLEGFEAEGFGSNNAKLR